MPVDAEVGGEPVELEGEVVDEPIALQAQPTFTPEQIKQDGVNAVSRTGLQVFGGANVVVVLHYLLERYLPAHLPPEVVLIEAVGLAGLGVAYLMNRKRIKHGQV